MEEYIVIVEPGLQDQGGHAFNAIVQIESAFKTAGYKVILIGPENSKVSLPNFLKILPPMPAFFLRKLLFAKDYTAQFQRSIRELAEKYNPRFLLFTTGDGLLNLFALPRLNQIQIIVFHALLSNIEKNLLKRFFFKTFVLKKLKQRNVLFFVTTAIEDYQRFFGDHRVRWIPFPIGAVEEDAPTDAPSKPLLKEPRWIAYLGAARPEKGFCKIIEVIKNSPPEYYFMVQTNICPGYERDATLRRSLQNLLSMARSRDNLCLIEGPLTKEEYLSYLRKAGLLLLLYDQRYYRYSISGILLEAFALGKPVVTTSGTWVGEQVERYGGGIVLHRVSVEVVLTAIREILENYEEFSEKALKAGKELRKLYSAESFVKTVLKTIPQG